MHGLFKSTAVLAATATMAYAQPAVQPRVEQVPPGDRIERAEQGALAATGQGRLARASSLIGASVKGQDGEMLGKIEDLVVDTQANRIEYVVIEDARATDRGLLVLPWAVAVYEPSRAAAQPAIINVRLGQDRLRAAPYVAVDDFRNFQQHAWTEKVDSYYRADVDRFRRDRRDRFNRDGDRNNLRNDLRDGRDDAIERRNEARDEARERLEDAAERTREQREEIRERTRERVNDAAERAKEAAEDAAERVDDDN